MKNLGVHYASSIGVAPGEDPNWTQFGVIAEDTRIGFFLPTLEIHGVFMAILGSAVEAAKQLPLDEVVESQALSIERQMQQPVEIVGIRRAADGDLLLLNTGVGTLAFQLTDSAKEELTQLCREIG
ncbi:hypothetical protein [Solidesulfovibrio fructosivorans]|uniref:hypothetical protein n=1 Tax=Solidesulfovibrio fructosivorans TaxID=878 RepID=UPI0005C13441|nr:hypothetical protein [Solidesulfovibrio fructosivorans]